MNNDLDLAATNSARSAMACPHYWLLRYGLKLTNEHARSYPLALGTYWHELLDLVWATGAESARKRLAQDTTAANEAHEGGFDPAREQDTAQRVRIVECAADMLEGYVAVYGVDGLGDLRESGVELISTERVLGPNPFGRGTYSGKVDKLVRINGALWVLDHKSTSRDLRDWRIKNEYSPQGLTYAVQVEDEFGEPVRGVIYDLASTSTTASAGDYKTLKSGAIGKPRAGAPPTKVGGRIATRESFVAAISAASNQDAPAWYADLLGVVDDPLRLVGSAIAALPTIQEARETYLYRREMIIVDAEDIERRRAEMIIEAEAMLDWHLMIKGAETIATRKAAIRTRQDSLSLPVPERFTPDEDWRQHVVDTLEVVGTSFPRNGDQCYIWQRPCELMSICRRPSVDACAGLVQRQHTHAELTTGETNE